jgi:hypothetical protein
MRHCAMQGAISSAPEEPRRVKIHNLRRLGGGGGANASHFITEPPVLAREAALECRARQGRVAGSRNDSEASVLLRSTDARAPFRNCRVMRLRLATLRLARLWLMTVKGDEG